MKRFRDLAAGLLLALAMTFSCTGEKAPPAADRRQAEAPAPEGVIVALGDSLTAGLGVNEDEAWPALLQERLRGEGRHWTVVNAGISGETSSGARARIGWIMKLEPDIVILATGANDGLRGLPVSLLRKNLDATVEELRLADVTVVLAGMRMVTNLGPQYTKEFADVYSETAKKHEILFIPFLLEGVAGDPDLNQPDGIHPTAEGHRVMAATLYPSVVEAVDLLTQP